ncbi:MAG: hypothetical protein KGL56_14020, partial [Alphaproteobacteria bacterium]|nr:hypothetical protein [Alphaproteobacteria bacterium]
MDFTSAFIAVLSVVQKGKSPGRNQQYLPQAPRNSPAFNRSQEAPCPNHALAFADARSFRKTAIHISGSCVQARERLPQ